MFCLYALHEFNFLIVIAAFIGDIVVFYNSKDLNCVGRCVFLKIFIVNCSQTKFVAIILVLLVFLFHAIFRLTDFSSVAFDFSSSKTG